VCGFSPEMKEGYRVFVTEGLSAPAFDPLFFSGLAECENGHWWFQSRNHIILWALRRYFPQCKDFFEIGCGTGFVLQGIQRALPSLRLSGSDIFKEGLLFARRRLPDVSFYQIDASRIPFEEEFDVIGAFDILEHLQEDEEVLSQAFRAVRPGGGIILTVPQHPALWSKMDEYSFHKRRYTRKELIHKVEKAGFRDVKGTSFVLFLLPMMYLYRKISYHREVKSEGLQELRIRGPLNRIFLKIMEIENFAIRNSLFLPFGGSLLLTALKDGKC